MDKRGKTILILGNGFDLAHDLPTKYSHFLEFCRRVVKIWTWRLDAREYAISSFEKQWIENWVTDESIVTAIVTAFENRVIMFDVQDAPKVKSDNLELSEIHNLLDDNVWYNYFIELYTSNQMKGENWIDFESEIRFIIKAVDEKTLSLTNYWDDVITYNIRASRDSKIDRFYKELKFIKYKQKKGLPEEYFPTVKDFREKAFEDLTRLTRALEIYLTAFVEKIPIEKMKRIPEIEDLNPDYVINFNYTNTYQKVYKKEAYHIHGKADVDHSVEDNNMVLGIDEYWTGNEQDEKTNFTIFKKFAQRIQKHTGNESYRYLEEIQSQFAVKRNVWSDFVDKTRNHPEGVSYVYVFGHSLDVTDKDILSGFIGDDATSVTIYCMDKGTEGELIANTIRLITEEKLLKKVNHVPTKLRYVIQKNDKNI